MPDACVTGLATAFGGTDERRTSAPSTLPADVPTPTPPLPGPRVPLPVEAVEPGIARPNPRPPPGTITPIALRAAPLSGPERLMGGMAPMLADGAPIFADGAAGIFGAFAISVFRLARRCRLAEPPSSLIGSTPRPNVPPRSDGVAPGAPAGAAAPLRFGSAPGPAWAGELPRAAPASPGWLWSTPRPPPESLRWALAPPPPPAPREASRSELAFAASSCARPGPAVRTAHIATATANPKLFMRLSIN